MRFDLTALAETKPKEEKKKAFAAKKDFFVQVSSLPLCVALHLVVILFADTSSDVHNCYQHLKNYGEAACPQMPGLQCWNIKRKLLQYTHHGTAFCLKSRIVML